MAAYPLPGSGWCERAERLVSDRLDDCLEDSRLLDAHLANCERCVEHERRLVQAQDALVASFVSSAGLAQPAPSPEPPPALKVAPEPVAAPPAPVAPEPAEPRAPLSASGLAWATLAVLAVLLTRGGHRGRRRRRGRRPLGEHRLDSSHEAVRGRHRHRHPPALACVADEVGARARPRRRSRARRSPRASRGGPRAVIREGRGHRRGRAARPRPSRPAATAAASRAARGPPRLPQSRSPRPARRPRPYATCREPRAEPAPPRAPAPCTRTRLRGLAPLLGLLAAPALVLADLLLARPPR